MPDYRLSRKLFVQRWNAKPVRVDKGNKVVTFFIGHR